jgi:hypothetical protein
MAIVNICYYVISGEASGRRNKDTIPYYNDDPATYTDKILAGSLENKRTPFFFTDYKKSLNTD